MRAAFHATAARWFLVWRTAKLNRMLTPCLDPRLRGMTVWRYWFLKVLRQAGFQLTLFAQGQNRARFNLNRPPAFKHKLSWTCQRYALAWAGPEHAQTTAW